MRILVGTLATIENELDRCRESIRVQDHRDIEHFVVRDLPNKEAHDALFRRFMEEAGRFDLFIKVDADMVLRSRDLFRKIVRRFEADRDLGLLEIQVHDWFSDGLIWGLNAFRSHARWIPSRENLFVDLTLDLRTIGRRIADSTDLAPAADHCPDPGPYQSFHFGFHRARKAVQPGRRRARRNGMQWRTLLDVRRHAARNPDRRLLLALLGAEEGLVRTWGDESISYGDGRVRRLFDLVKGLSSEELMSVIRSRQRARLGALPYPLDYGLMFSLHRARAILCPPESRTASRRPATPRRA